MDLSTNQNQAIPNSSAVQTGQSPSLVEYCVTITTEINMTWVLFFDMQVKLSKEGGGGGGGWSRTGANFFWSVRKTQKYRH